MQVGSPHVTQFFCDVGWMLTRDLFRNRFKKFFLMHSETSTTNAKPPIDAPTIHFQLMAPVVITRVDILEHSELSFFIALKFLQTHVSFPVQSVLRSHIHEPFGTLLDKSSSSSSSPLPRKDNLSCSCFKSLHISAFLKQEIDPGFPVTLKLITKCLTTVSDKLDLQ